MKAILRLTYDDNKNILQYFNNVTEESVLKFVEEMNIKQGINTTIKNIEFMPNFSDEAEIWRFLIRQRIFFNMAQIANFKFERKTYIDDVLFHDKNIIFTTTEDKLYWIVGESYSYIYSKKHIDYMSNDTILYFLKSDADIYVINVNDATIDKLSDEIREKKIKELKKEIEKSLV